MGAIHGLIDFEFKNEKIRKEIQKEKPRSVICNQCIKKKEKRKNHRIISWSSRRLNS